MDAAERPTQQFARLGLVTQTPEGRYDLGPFALEMGLVSLNRQDPMRRARPAAAALRDEIEHDIGTEAVDIADRTTQTVEQLAERGLQLVRLGERVALDAAGERVCEAGPAGGPVGEIEKTEVGGEETGDDGVEGELPGAVAGPIPMSPSGWLASF